jgi:hypothetical protein
MYPKSGRIRQINKTKGTPSTNQPDLRSLLKKKILLISFISISPNSNLPKYRQHLNPKNYTRLREKKQFYISQSN